MDFRKLLSLGSQKAPKVIDDLVAPGKSLVKKGALEADEIIGGAAKRKPNLQDIMDAEIVSKADPSKMDPRLAALLTAGAGGAYFVSKGGDGNEPPVNNIPMNKMIEEPEQFPIDEMDAGAQAEALSMPPVTNEIKKIQSAPRTTSISEEKAPVLSEQELMLNRLQQAQDADAQDRFMSGLLRAGTTIGGAVAMTKPDYSGVEALEKNIGVNEKNLKSQISTKSDIQKLNQAQLQLEDENKLRDPNSSASKLVKQILAKQGINVNTAQEAKNVGINVQNIILQEMASADRMKMAEISKDQKLAKEEKKLSEDQKKFTRDLRKEATSGVLGKQYATYSTGQRMSNALTEFAKNPSGYKDYATLMGGLKSLQGDESVVREAEVRMGMSATSLFDSLQNQLQKAATGKLLQPNQRKQMIETIEILTGISQQQYMQSVQPILEQAEREGIDRSLILPGSLVGQNKQEKSVQKQTVKLSNNKQPGAIITTKSGKTFRVNSDGLTATEQ